MRPQIFQLARFAVVGASNTAITLASYAALVMLGAPAVAASAVGFALGAANGYHWIRRWTFRSDRRGAVTTGRCPLPHEGVYTFSSPGSAACRAISTKRPESPRSSRESWMTSPAARANDLVAELERLSANAKRMMKRIAN